MSSEDQRRAARQATWAGRRGSSFEELAKIDLELALAVPDANSLRVTWSLVEDALALKAHDGPAPRLQRLVGGVRPFAS